MGTSKLSAKPDEIQGGYFVIDWHPIQGGEVILLSLHAAETGTSSGWMDHLGPVQHLPFMSLNLVTKTL